MVDEGRALESGRIGVAASLEHRQRHRLLTRQTLIANTGLPHITLMASTISLHGAHDQKVSVGDRLCAVGRLVNVVHTKLQCTIGRGESQQSFMPLHTRSCTWNKDERWREGGTDAGGGGGEREISEGGNRVGIGDWVVHVDRYCHWFSTFSVCERERTEVCSGCKPRQEKYQARNLPDQGVVRDAHGCIFILNNR